ncbi:MAG: hypothetical protein H7326_10470, partial [Bdellovibrionaceae bacterium]|nr:hypothetical protein [Pseudobdellovibrionaceae bacterium]
MRLEEYKRKRDFKKTSEPAGGKSKNKMPIFVVQEHLASHLHYDFRLEAFGVLLSWAVPKGPSTAVGDKRLAVQVEDHPIDYATFKGRIPDGEYGAGIVKIWDHGTWIEPENLKQQLEKGHIEFELRGKKLKGKWLLQRTNRSTGSKSQWLLIKRHDDQGKKAASVKIPNKIKSPDKFPDFVSPQLALLMDEVPSGDRFIHEVKFDGYRTQARIQGKSVELLTRKGLDWTEKYAPLDKELLKLKIKSAIFDGEVVVLDSAGGTDFSALQLALKNDDMSGVVFYVFDLLYLNGEDLRSRPLEERKLILKKVLRDGRSKKILYSEHVRGQGQELLSKMARLGLEGIVSKDRTLPYHSGRNSAWQKIKISKRQELVIGGHTDPEGSRAGLGALLMGVYEGKK